ncbi:MAG: hypothetical protein RJQ09_13095 [Cyclobacteriaceae bacterium]
MKITHAEGRDVFYGLGIFRTFYKGHNIYWHSGFTQAYSSYLGIIEETGEIVVVINNQWTNEEVETIFYDLLDQLLDNT